MTKIVFYSIMNKVSEKFAVAFSERNKSRLYFGVLKRRLFSFAPCRFFGVDFKKKSYLLHAKEFIWQINFL